MKGNGAHACARLSEQDGGIKINETGNACAEPLRRWGRVMYTSVYHTVMSRARGDACQSCALAHVFDFIMFSSLYKRLQCIGRIHIARINEIDFNGQIVKHVFKSRRPEIKEISIERVLVTSEFTPSKSHLESYQRVRAEVSALKPLAYTLSVPFGSVFMNDANTLLRQFRIHSLHSLAESAPAADSNAIDITPCVYASPHTGLLRRRCR